MNKPTIINETINNILEKTINNLEEPKINNNEQSTINKESKTINNLEEPKISNNKKLNFVKTPEFLISMKAILNPHTVDDKSFQDFITLFLYHKRIGKNFCRPENIRKYDIFNWGNINFPPKYEDYEQFEIDNKDVRLSILKIYGKEKKQYDRGYDRDYEVNLLLLENKHYTYVKNLAPLLLYSSSESESKS